MRGTAVRAREYWPEAILWSLAQSRDQASLKAAVGEFLGSQPGRSFTASFSRALRTAERRGWVFVERSRAGNAVWVGLTDEGAQVRAEIHVRPDDIPIWAPRRRTRREMAGDRERAALARRLEDALAENQRLREEISRLEASLVEDERPTGRASGH
ncbi:MAG: hypothetical protein AB1778_04820 [Candidatus Bipolaricaulota bacterium]